MELWPQGRAPRAGSAPAAGGGDRRVRSTNASIDVRVDGYGYRTRARRATDPRTHVSPLAGCNGDGLDHDAAGWED
eukprot:COSAG02_NODE_6796_length_3355_cov_2.471437_3_plen_76_part_00